MEKMIELIDFRLVDDANPNGLADKVHHHLGLPDSTFLGTRITKKMLIDNNELSSHDKKLVTDVIQSIEWLNTLKPETLNIPVYVTDTVEYIEIAVMRVVLKNAENSTNSKNMGKLSSLSLSKVGKLLHTLIPYPVILFLELGEELAISLADKRINQADKSKLVIEHIYNSDWLSSAGLTRNENTFLNNFSLKNVSNLNYFELYQGLISILIGLEIKKVSGYDLAKNSSSFSDKSNEDKTALLKELRGLEAELGSIRNKIKTETQMNTKMRLNVDAKNIKQAIAAIKNQIA